MSEQKGIKELSELIAGVEVLAIAIKKVMKDGKVDLSDAAVLVELGGQFDLLAAAVEGLQDIATEAQDIDAQEAVSLVGQLYGLAKKVQEA